MNLEYLKDLLTNVNSLTASHDQVTKADEIKMKASEAIKAIFPSEFSTAGAISRLDFKPKRLVSLDGGLSYSWAKFRESKSMLASTLAAKIDLLEYQLKQTAVKAEKEPESLEVKVLKIQLQKLSNKNDKFAELVDQSMKESDELSSKLKQANADLKDMSSDLTRLSKERDRAKNINWGKTWTMMAIAFGIGAGTVAVKVDFDKRRLQDTVDEQKSTIDSLKKIVSNKQRPSTVPKVK